MRLAFVLLTLGLLAGCGASFGKKPTSTQKLAFSRSTQFDGKRFKNAQTMYTNTWGAIGTILSGSRHKRPAASPSTEKPSFRPTPPASGLRVTWLGHSTILIEIDGKRFLTDPVWSERTSPYQWLGPRRFYAPPLALAELPSLDAVLISHDHYDHLDYATILHLNERGERFITPLGVGAHLRHWGVPGDRITELDWWGEADLGEVTVACVPSRHASGRGLSMNHTLWAGYALVGSKHRAYFSGDTGMFHGLSEIGERYGPFDVTMIEVGAYGKHWPDWHLGPEQAVVAHRMVRGKFLLPIHWGLFDLAAHSWVEPMERVLSEGHEQGVSVATPRPGQSIELDDVANTERWWAKTPYQTAEESPIVATENGDKRKRMDLKKLLREVPSEKTEPSLSAPR